MIKEKNNDLKNMFIGITVIFLYLILSSMPYDFLSLFGVNLNKLSLIFKEIYLVIYEVILLAVIILIYKDEVITSFKDFKKDMLKYLKKYIKYWLVMLMLMIISNLIVTLFTTSNTPQNQKIVIDQLKLAPIYSFITVVLISPILEELVFRLSFKRIFPYTNCLYIFFSGLFFGFIHVIGSLESLSDLLFIIPYSIPGFMFAYTYSKTKNICVPVSLHMIHNFVMIVFQLILMSL